MNEDNSYFICSIDKKKIGFIRYEKNNEHSLAVSINLDPKYRNMGLGTEMLLKTQRKKKIKDKNCILYARIKKNNIGSIKAFEKAGYSKVKELNNYYLFCNNGNHANVWLMTKSKKQDNNLINNKIMLVF